MISTKTIILNSGDILIANNEITPPFTIAELLANYDVKIGNKWVGRSASFGSSDGELSIAALSDNTEIILRWANNPDGFGFPIE